MAFANERRDLRVPRPPAWRRRRRLPRPARRALPLDASKKVRALSKGNRQKVQLIAALASRAELLILDEPTSGLDPADGDRLPRERPRSKGTRSDDLSLLTHPQRGRGAMRSGRNPPPGPPRRRGHAHRVAPPRLPDGRSHLQRSGAPTSTRCQASSWRAPATNALRFEVSGRVGPLIAALAEHPVLTLTSREPSLEEIFLHHYDGLRRACRRLVRSRAGRSPTRRARGRSPSRCSSPSSRMPARRLPRLPTRR